MNRRRKCAPRPIVERLEGRALMALGGGFDPTFAGGAGYAIGTLDLSGNPGYVGPTGVATEPDGSILVAYPDASAADANNPSGMTIAVSEYSASGTLNTTFGSSGKADITLPTDFYPTGASPQILVRPNGQFVALLPVEDASTFEVVVEGFKADGSVDTSFGTAGVEDLSSTTRLLFSALEPDGDIAALLGNTLEQLTANGEPDSTFGTNGQVTIPDGVTGIGIQTYTNLAVNADDQILVGVDDNPNPNQPVSTISLLRYDTDGTLDSSFDSSGIGTSVLTDLTSLAINPGGQIVVLGQGTQSNTETPAMAVLNPDGSVLSSGAFLNDTYIPQNLLIGSDGDLTIELNLTYNLSSEDLLRLNSNLTPDESFGEGGLAPVHVPAPVAGNANVFSVDDVALTSTDQVITTGRNSAAASAYYVGLLTSSPTPATPGDFTGDGISDPAVFLAGTSTFVIGNSGGGAGQVVQLGTPGLGNTLPAPGDYYATGQEDVAAYLADSGLYAIKDPTGQTLGLLLPIGIKGVGQTLPAPGDYFGVGSDQVAVYVAQSATWDILAPGLKPGLTFPFGVPGVGNTIPVPGDYFGTGADDVAVYLPQSGTWSILTPGLSSVINVNFGIPGAGNTIPVPGDYDGSGHTELGVYLPALGELQYISGVGKVVTVPFGVKGAGQTLPEPGDFDGSGKTEIGAYIPSTNSFEYLPASGGAVQSFVVGFTAEGPIVPVTSVVPTSLVGSPSVEEASVLGETDDLDFVMPLASDSKKEKPGGSSTD